MGEGGFGGGRTFGLSGWRVQCVRGESDMWRVLRLLRSACCECFLGVMLESFGWTRAGAGLVMSVGALQSFERRLPLTKTYVV